MRVRSWRYGHSGRLGRRGGAAGPDRASHEAAGRAPRGLPGGGGPRRRGGGDEPHRRRPHRRGERAGGPQRRRRAQLRPEPGVPRVQLLLVRRERDGHPLRRRDRHGNPRCSDRRPRCSVRQSPGRPPRCGDRPGRAAARGVPALPAHLLGRRPARYRSLGRAQQRLARAKLYGTNADDNGIGSATSPTVVDANQSNAVAYSRTAAQCST